MEMYNTSVKNDFTEEGKGHTILQVQFRLYNE